MEWKDEAELIKFKNASIAKQTKWAPKIQHYLEYRRDNHEDMGKLHLSIALPLYGVKELAVEKQHEELSPLDQMFDSYESSQKSNVNSIVQAILSQSKRADDRIQIGKVLINMKLVDGSADVYVLRIRLENEEEKRVIGFADGEGRFYTNWLKFLENNKLPKCFMVFPKHGRYNSVDDGEWELEAGFSCACNMMNVAMEKGDFLSCIGGLAATGIVITSSFFRLPTPVLAAAGLAGLVAGGYSTVRSAATLIDRNVHYQTLSMSNKESRHLWLSAVAGTAGMTSMAVIRAIGPKLRSPAVVFHHKNISTLHIFAYDCAAHTGLFTTGAHLADHIYTLMTEKRKPTWTETAQLSVSLFFFFNIVVNVKTSRMIIENIRRRHCQVLQAMESQRGQQNGMEDELSVIFEKLWEHEKSLQKLNDAVFNGKSAEDGESARHRKRFAEELHDLGQFFVDMWHHNNQNPTKDSCPHQKEPSHIKAEKSFHDAFMAHDDTKPLIKPDYDPNYNLVADFFEFDFSGLGNEKHDSH